MRVIQKANATNILIDFVTVLHGRFSAVVSRPGNQVRCNFTRVHTAYYSRVARVKKGGMGVSELVGSRKNGRQEARHMLVLHGAATKCASHAHMAGKLTFFLLLRHDVLSCGVKRAKRALHAAVFSLQGFLQRQKRKKKEFYPKKTLNSGFK